MDRASCPEKKRPPARACTWPPLAGGDFQWFTIALNPPSLTKSRNSSNQGSTSTMLDARPIAPAMSLASRRLTLPPWLRSSHVSYFPNDALRRIHSAHAFHVRTKLMPFIGPFLLVLISRTLKIRGSISLVVTLKSFPARCWPEAPAAGTSR
jgi:hypothetical protein